MAFKPVWLYQKGSGWDLFTREHSVEKYLEFTDTIWTAPVTLMEGIMQDTYSTPESLRTALEQLDNSLQQIR